MELPKISSEELIAVLRTEEYKLFSSKLDEFREGMSKANKKKTKDIRAQILSLSGYLQYEKPVIFEALRTSILELEELYINKMTGKTIIID